MQISRSFAEIDPSLCEATETKAFPTPSLLLFNEALAKQLGLDKQLVENRTELARMLCGQQAIHESITSPFAFAYAGHQFGHFNPRLGDGRAHYLCEILAPGKHSATEERYDLQLKGSGPTPFSRGGDGLCALGPALREYIMGEALYALGVPTTRSLSVVTTGEHVWRNAPAPGAVVSRVARSHIRVGTFQYFAYRGKAEVLKKLVDYTLKRHFPALYQQNQNEDIGQRSVALLNAVIEGQVHLICEWMRVGFIHGVMNTDNTLLAGDTIDFGPCAMLGVYAPDTTFSSIDHNKRYAFANQADIALWNITRFAECLIQLIDKENPDHAISVLAPELEQFSKKFSAAYDAMMAKKLGFLEVSEQTRQCANQWLELLHQHKLDYTNSFNFLSDALSTAELKHDNAEITDFVTHWRSLIVAQPYSSEHIASTMQETNPYIIPRNHLVEAAIEDCVNNASLTKVQALLASLTTPYQRAQHLAPYIQVPADIDQNYVTYCGT